MVKGITKRVIMVRNPDPNKYFEQALFFVSEDVYQRGSVTEEMLMKEANRVANRRIVQKWRLRKEYLLRAGFAIGGALAVFLATMVVPTLL